METTALFPKRSNGFFNLCIYMYDTFYFDVKGLSDACVCRENVLRMCQVSKKSDHKRFFFWFCASINFRKVDRNEMGGLSSTIRGLCEKNCLPFTVIHSLLRNALDCKKASLKVGHNSEFPKKQEAF